MAGYIGKPEITHKAGQLTKGSENMTINFDTPFPNECLGVFLQCKSGSGGALNPIVYNFNATLFKVHSGTENLVFWHAIGV